MSGIRFGEYDFFYRAVCEGIDSDEFDETFGDMKFFKFGVSRKCARSDRSDGIGHNERGKRGAAVKRVCAYGFEPASLGENDFGKLRAFMETLTSYGYDRRRNSYRRNLRLVEKSVGQIFDSFGNNEFLTPLQ